jgi:hypothetical protein
LAQTVVASIVALLGIRMLLVAARTRTLAEAWIGLFFLSTGVGAELALRGIGLSASDPALAERLVLIGVPVLSVATVSGYAFTYTVFRRGESWAAALVAFGVVLAAWGTWQQLGGASLQPETIALRVEFLIGRFLCFAWGAYEGLHAYRMARRRLALGLADPVVTNRFLLFGIWFGLMGVNPVVLTLSRLYGDAAALEMANAIGPKVIGSIMSVALVLTFFPPRRYLQWLSSRQQAPLP